MSITTSWWSRTPTRLCQSSNFFPLDGMSCDRYVSAAARAWGHLCTFDWNRFRKREINNNGVILVIRQKYLKIRL